MKVEADTIEQLIARSGPRRETLERLDALIREAAPQLPRRLYVKPSITMIGYGARADHDDDWPIIALAPQKHRVSMYVAADRDGEPLLSVYGDRLGRVSLGRSCMRVGRFELLDADVLRQLVREAAGT